MSNTENTFVWNDELVKEFADNVPIDEICNQSHIDQFKQSKTATAKPEWEIVSFISSLGVIASLKEDGFYRYTTHGGWALDVMLKNHSIHSVRRTSDNEVFTVGDMIEGSQIDTHNIITKRPAQITSIRIINENIGLSYGDGGEILIKYAKKIPQPSPSNERIEVSIDYNFREYQVIVTATSPIQKDKFKQLKQSIEQVLNQPFTPTTQPTEEDKPVVIENNDRCGICGGEMVYIRGRYPNTDKRKVCPTCITERLEQISEISSKDYGKTSQSI